MRTIWTCMCEATKRFCSVTRVESPGCFHDCQGSFYVEKSMLQEINQIFGGISGICVSFVLYALYSFLVKAKLMEFLVFFFVSRPVSEFDKL